MLDFKLKTSALAALPEQIRILKRLWILIRIWAANHTKNWTTTKFSKKNIYSEFGALANQLHLWPFAASQIYSPPPETSVNYWFPEKMPIMNNVLLNNCGVCLGTAVFVLKTPHSLNNHEIKSLVM